MIRIANRPFRRALLSLNGLASPPPGDPLPAPTATSGPEWVHGMVSRLGFVQVDSISTIERAQHQVLFSRNPRYRQDDLVQLLERDRQLFEHWTHDAAILPVESYPYWKHYFERTKDFEAHPGYRRYFAPVTPGEIARVLRRITKDGPVRPRDFDSRRPDWVDPKFQIPTLAKITLEYLWRTGRVAVTRREGREKVYDLSERVIPREFFKGKVSRTSYVDWACRESLKRLGAGSPAQMARFFDAVSREDAAAWSRKHLGREIVEVRVTQADGAAGSPALALASLVEMMGDFTPAPRALRLINPFDPLIRDRRRTQRVFGFDYAVEIFVPSKKRRYGYYVLPILEGERFTGRIDAKVDRKRDTLGVLGLWWEAGVKATGTRTRQLQRELERLAGFAGVACVSFPRGHLKS